MLVLTRSLMESIYIGKDKQIKITILGVNRGQVKVGIDAPKELSVHREEVLERILKEEEEFSYE